MFVHVNCVTTDITVVDYQMMTVWEMMFVNNNSCIKWIIVVRLSNAQWIMFFIKLNKKLCQKLIVTAQITGKLSRHTQTRGVYAIVQTL